MVAHKAAFDAGEVERLVILVVVILGAEVFIPVAGHILLEKSYKVFEEFESVLSQFIAELATGDDDTPVGVVAHALAVLPEAEIDIQTSLVNTDADAVFVSHITVVTVITCSICVVAVAPVHHMMLSSYMVFLQLHHSDNLSDLPHVHYRWPIVNR